MKIILRIPRIDLLKLGTDFLLCGSNFCTFLLELIHSASNLNLVASKIILQLVQFKSNLSFYNQTMSESSLHTMQPPKLINLRISYAPRELVAAPELVATLAEGTTFKDGP